MSKRSEPGRAKHTPDTARPDPAKLGDAVLEAGPNPLVIVDHDGRIVHLNRACEAFFGKQLEQDRGIPIWSLWEDAQEREQAEAAFRRLVAGEHWDSHVLSCTKTAGEKYVLRWSNSVIYDEQGRVGYLIAHGTDITDHWRSVQELHEERGRLEGILASAMDAIITVDHSQNVRFFNAAAEKMFGRPASEAIGQPLDVFIPQRFREKHREHLRRFGEEGTTNRTMGHLRPLAALRADGSEFPIEASISHVAVGGEMLFTAIVRDITARVRAEQDLREAEARFRSIFEHAGTGIVMSDANGIILEANAAMERMLLYSDAELRGLRYIKITHPEDVAITREHLSAIVADQDDIREFEKRYIRKDGVPVWARVSLSVVRGTDGQVRYVVKTVDDITARKRAEAKARRAKARHAKVLRRFARLTDREREVMWLMVAGKPTKNIASDLGASPKTIEAHRGRVMEKMQADSVARLVQMVMPIRSLVASTGPGASAPSRPTSED